MTGAIRRPTAAARASRRPGKPRNPGSPGNPGQHGRPSTGAPGAAPSPIIRSLLTRFLGDLPEAVQPWQSRGQHTRRHRPSQVFVRAIRPPTHLSPAAAVATRASTDRPARRPALASSHRQEGQPGSYPPPPAAVVGQATMAKQRSFAVDATATGPRTRPVGASWSKPGSWREPSRELSGAAVAPRRRPNRRRHRQPGRRPGHQAGDGPGNQSESSGKWREAAGSSENPRKETVRKGRRPTAECSAVGRRPITQPVGSGQPARPSITTELSLFIHRARRSPTRPFTARNRRRTPDVRSAPRSRQGRRRTPPPRTGSPRRPHRPAPRRPPPRRRPRWRPPRHRSCRRR